MNNELKYFKENNRDLIGVLSQNLPGGPEENPEEHQDNRYPN
jgi:hypothetical protein